MPQIHAPELAAQIREQYGVRGAQGFDTIAPEIIPVTIVDDLTPKGGPGRLCAGSRTQAAVAGQNAIVGLTALNVDRGALNVIVRRVAVWSSTAGQVWIYAPYQGAVTFANTGDKVFLDRRIAGRPATSLGGLNQVGNPTGSVIAMLNVLANETLQFDLIGCVLSPVTGKPVTGANQILAIHQTVNVPLTASFIWEEASVEPGVP